MTRVLVPLFLLVAGFAQASDYSTVQIKLLAAMASDVRTQAEIDCDDKRLPLETLEFFGLGDDIKVVELLPGDRGSLKFMKPVG